MEAPRWSEYPLPFYILGSDKAWALFSDDLGCYPVPYEGHNNPCSPDEPVFVDATKE